MRTLQQFLTVTCVLFMVYHAAAQDKQQAFPDTLVQRLGSTFIKEPKHAGLSIGIYNDGKEYFYNFGTTKKGTTITPTETTLYEIGSITKVFVSLVLANAILEKKINLDDDIRKYITNSYPNLEYNGKPITVKHLVNTTSGIPNWMPETPVKITNAPADSTSFLREKYNRSYTSKDFFDALKKVKPDTVPGFKTRHSNGAAQLLTYIVEKAYNESIEKLVKKYILKPTAMSNTIFCTAKSNNAKLAAGYDEKGNESPYFSSEYLVGAAGLNSSTSDLLKFIALQLKDDKAVMLTHKPTFNAGYYQIGFNWLIYKHDNGYQQLWTDGGTYGFCSYVILYPELKSGVVLLSNEVDDATPGKLGDMAYQIFQLLIKNKKQ